MNSICRKVQQKWNNLAVQKIYEIIPRMLELGVTYFHSQRQFII